MHNNIFIWNQQQQQKFLSLISLHCFLDHKVSPFCCFHFLYFTLSIYNTKNEKPLLLQHFSFQSSCFSLAFVGFFLVSLSGLRGLWFHTLCKYFKDCFFFFENWIMFHANVLNLVIRGYWKVVIMWIILLFGIWVLRFLVNEG